MRHFTENAELGSFNRKTGTERCSLTALWITLSGCALAASCYSAQLFERKTKQT